MPRKKFRDRREAGRMLARALAGYSDRPDVFVLALPRGGVPVAFEVAQSLVAPLDVCLVRKLGVPGHDGLAMGAIASGGARAMNDEVVQALGIDQVAIDEAARRERSELQRLERLYRKARATPELRGLVVLLVDDGLATGATMFAAVRAVRTLQPARIVVAVPVASVDTCEALREEADEVVCAATHEFFFAIGLWYEDFSQIEDDEIRQLIEQANTHYATNARRKAR
jgi:predicted phosphoribosyltransferase